MKAADDQVTRRKGTKAIPLRKHSIAVRGRALSSSDHEAGLLRAAWRRWPRHRQLTRGGTEAPRLPGQAQPRREGSAQRREGGGRTGSRVGGARAVLACCETGEVTKRQPGPAELERAATSPPTPRHAGPLGFLSLLLGTAIGGCGGRRGTRRGWSALGQVLPSWLDSQLHRPLGVFPLSLCLHHPLSFPQASGHR